MLKPIDKWFLEIKKSYIKMDFEFNTAEGAVDFYELFMEAYAEDDDKEIKARIYPIFKEQNEEEE